MSFIGANDPNGPDYSDVKPISEAANFALKIIAGLIGSAIVSGGVASCAKSSYTNDNISAIRRAIPKTMYTGNAEILEDGIGFKISLTHLFDKNPANRFLPADTFAVQKDKTPNAYYVAEIKFPEQFSATLNRGTGWKEFLQGDKPKSAQILIGVKEGTEGLTKEGNTYIATPALEMSLRKVTERLQKEFDAKALPSTSYTR